MAHVSLAAAMTAALAVADLAADAERPVLEPVRDVRVTYKSFGGGVLERAWSARLRRLRTEQGAIWTVRTLGASQVTEVDEEARTVAVTELGFDPDQRLGPAPDAAYAPLGTDKVAGHDCRLWQVQEGGQAAELCVTEDGVLLRHRIGGLEMVAVSVAYGELPASMFEPPAGYERID